MNNSNMINPANYYNPFAKYNYISKTRGIYIPQNSEPLINYAVDNKEKSTSIYSENYDAETDINNLITKEETKDIFTMFNEIFSRKKNI